MSSVTNYLHQLIARQVKDHRLVVWFDPERHYADIVATLTLPDATIVRYEGSFFALRHAIDPLLSSDAPPRLLVYVPLAEEATYDALIEITATAAILKPGQGSLQRNTRLSVVTRHALREQLGAERADDLARQVESGKFSLADLDRLGGMDGGPPVLKTIFGTGNPPDVALAFLNSDRFDAQINSRHATDDLVHVLTDVFGVRLAPASNCEQVRSSFARSVLLVEFLASLGRPLPPELATITTPDDATIRQACVDLVRAWRMRRDLQSSYVEHATSVDRALGLASLTFPLDIIRTSETFPAVETALQTAVEAALTHEVTPELLSLVQQRLASFWAEQRPTLQARWALIHTAGQLLFEAARIERELKQIAAEPVALLRAYAEGEQPWCLLDTYQRHLERRWHTFELSDLATHQTLEALVSRARHRFMEVGDALATAFVGSLTTSRYVLPGLPRQRDTFAKSVRPALANGKTAYVLVDALRFEMARELMQSFDDEFQSQLSLAVGTVPSITEIGMAALMPGAEGDVAIVPAGDGKVGLKIAETILKDRRTRLDWLRKQLAIPLVVTTLEEMLPKPKDAALEQELHQAKLILVTSQEIDELAERDNIRLARKVMDDVLADLARLVRKLREYGCTTIVIAADHGYLFGDELESDMKIDPPKGQTVDLHRRVWIGRGGVASDSFMRTSLANFGLSDTLEVAVPWGFGAFKVSGGARAYFHGGLSPQEIAIPVLVLHTMSAGRVTPLNAISWELTTGSKKISTRFFSVQIAARSTSLFEFDPPRVRLEIRSKGENVAEPVSATYGLLSGTHEIELHTQPDDPQRVQPNTITLMIAGTPGKTASIHLLDATTGRELGRIEKIDVALLAW